VTLKDRLASFVRTFTPQLVGLLLTWIATHWGWEIPEEWANEIKFLAIELVAGVYYAAVRFAEARWPRIGWLLGWAAQPVYVPAPEVPKVEATGVVKVNGESGHAEGWVSIVVVVLIVLIALKVFGVI
jgi:hypothetical protein